jgi:TonB-linked SusC/RagA family outer membrane protein
MRKFLSLLMVLILYSISTFAQTKPITGRVTDAQGQPVPYATIRIKGQKGGVSADADGYFTIKANSTQTLVVTGAGITAKEMVVGSEPNLTVQVTRQSSNLDEVVVTALGVRRSRNSLPYAAQQVSGDDLTKTVTTNVVNNLSGKVAGLQVTSSNSMGGSSNVILRGFRSLTQSNQALFVVDGVPYDNTITTGNGYDFGSAVSDLNPDDIASMSILKGAAASALYGSRGSNGVILVTTKKGLNRNGVAVSASFGVSTGKPDKSTLPTYQTQYGQGYNATNDAGFYNNVAVPWSNSPITVAPTPDDAATGPAYDKNLMVYNWDAFAPSDPNFHKATPWTAAPNHNPTDYFVTPLTTNENILVQSGGDNGTFKFGYTRTDEKGFMPNSNQKKNLFSINASRNITKGLSVEGGLIYVNENATNRGLYQYTAGTNPMTDFRQWWPTNVDIKAQKRDYFAQRQNETWNWTTDAYAANAPGNLTRPNYHDNLYWFAYQNPEQDSRNRYTGHVRANWAITDFLSVSGTATEDYYSQFVEQRNDVGSQAPSYYTRQTNNFNETNYNLQLNFNKNIAENLNLKALLGGNIQKDEITSVYSSTNGGLILPSYWSISNSVSTPNAPTETDKRKEIHSEYASATLTYKEMITLDGSLRRDQSSTLPTANNTYYYPSVSANWIFSKLIPNANWLNSGKVWVNFAQVGGDAPYYSVYNTYQINTPVNGQAVMSPLLDINNRSTNNNPKLVPEKNNTYETGLEMYFLDSRVGFTADYYHSVQKNEILPITVSTATGYNLFNVNGGSVQNQGIEVTLNLVPVRTRDFTWNMAINWAKNSNKVLSLYGGQPSYAIATLQNTIQVVAEVGKPYGILRGTDYVRKNGQKVITAAGYYEANPNPLSDIGNIQPDWIGGINNSFSYKNFSFSFLIDVHQGGDVYSLDMDYGSYSGLYPRTAGYNDLGNPVRSPLSQGGGIILKGVLDDGKTPNTTRIGEDAGTPSWTFGSGNGAGSEAKSQFVYSASFIKLREAAFSYSIPKKAIDGLHSVKGIDLSLSGRNLWIIHKNLPYADPEQGQAAGNSSIGFQNGAYPTMRTLNFIVKVKF